MSSCTMVGTFSRDLKLMRQKIFKKRYDKNWGLRTASHVWIFYKGMLERIYANGDFLRNTCCTDEFSFGLTGSANRQNDRIWALQNPHVVHEHLNQWHATVDGSARVPCHWTFFHQIWIECSEVRQCASSANTCWDSKGAASATGLLHAGPNLQPYSSQKCCLFEPAFSRKLDWKVRIALLVCALAGSKSLWFFLYSNSTSYANRDELKRAIEQYCFQISPQILILCVQTWMRHPVNRILFWRLSWIVARWRLTRD